MRFRRRRPRLQRQLFAWLVLTIVVTALAVAAVFRLANPDPGFYGRLERLEGFAAARFAEVWDEPARRQELALGLSEGLGVSLRLEGASGERLESVGGPCASPERSVAVTRDGRELGRVHGCFSDHHRRGGPLVGLLAFGAAAIVLWTAAAILSRKLTHPLSSLIAVTREIGAGKLKSRVRLGRHQRGDLGLLAEAVNDMAERIERQLAEQRELLAVVSHEVRSPLARLRVSTELLRDAPGNQQALAAIEREVADIDALVGKLLASSRLDFGSLARAPLDAAELTASVLERRGLDPALLDDRSAGAPWHADPTLIARALDNLLDNAERHGTAPARLVVRRARPDEHPSGERALVFEVWDRGRGFADGSLPRVFDAFYRGASGADERHASLGLGLSLVRRIAEAHGGRAFAENLPEGGARVGFSAG